MGTYPGYYGKINVPLLQSLAGFYSGFSSGEGGGTKGTIIELRGVMANVVIWYFYAAMWKHASVTPQEPLEIQILG